MARQHLHASPIAAPAGTWGVLLLAPALTALIAGPAAALPPAPVAPAATAAAIPADAATLGRLRISQRPCRLNSVKQTCLITVLEGSEAIRIDLSAGDRPFWVFTPAGAASTDRRPFRDGQGRTWLYSGHHSFQLVQQGPDRNVIEVESP